MPTRKASSAMFSRIAEVALKEFGRSDLYVAQVPAALAILSDTHLELLQQLEEDRLDNIASVTALVEISRVIDCIQEHPGIISTPQNNPGYRYLSDRFPKLVKNVKFLPAPLSEDEKQRYDWALATLYQEPKYLKTSAYQEYCILRAEVEKQEVSLLEMQKKLQGLAASAERDILKNEFDADTQLCTEKRQALEALDRAYSFNAAEDFIDRAERQIDGVPDSVRAMLDSIELFWVKNAANNDMHIACSFFPARLTEDNWAPLKLTSEDIARGEDKGGNAASNSNEIDDSQIDSIELEVQTLVCERPWLWQALFENRHWDWEAQLSPMSSGSEEWGKDDLIPAYIYALIFARNLTIKLRPSEQPPVDLVARRSELISSLLMREMMPSTIPHAELHEATSVQPIVLDNAAPLIEASMTVPTLSVAQPAAPAEIQLSDGLMRKNFRDINLAQILGRGGAFRGFAATGCVVNEQGRGVYQASVTLEGDAGQRRVTTGENGGFIFPAIAPGQYRVHVEKYGFTPVDSSIIVPQAAPETIPINQAASCQIMVHLQLDNGQPFVGTVKILIETADGQRLESMDQRSDAAFAMPPGELTISVSSPDADQISPSSVPVRMAADCSERPTITFTVSPASILQYSDVQLLGIVCRKVPRCPDPERQ